MPAVPRSCGHCIVSTDLGSVETTTINFGGISAAWVECLHTVMHLQGEFSGPIVGICEAVELESAENQSQLAD